MNKELDAMMQENISSTNSEISPQIEAKERRSFKKYAAIASSALALAGAIGGPSFQAEASSRFDKPVATKTENITKPNTVIPDAFEVVKSIQDASLIAIQPLVDDEQISLFPAKGLIRNIDRFNPIDKIEKVRVSQKIGSKIMKMVVSQEDSLFVDNFGETTVSRYYEGVPGVKGEYMTNMMREMPQYAVSPDIINQKKVTVKPYLMDKKGRLKSGGRTQDVPSFDNYLVAPLDHELTVGETLKTENGDYKVDSNKVLMAMRKSGISINLKKPLTKAQRKQGVYFKVKQSWKSRKPEYGHQKGDIESVYGPFGEAKQSKTSPSNLRAK